MKQSVILLTRDQNLLQQLRTILDDQYELLHCESLKKLQQQAAPPSLRAVMIHLCQQIQGDFSAGRFMGELSEAVKSSPIYALVDEDCPPSLRSLVGKTANFCLPMPLDTDRLKRTLSECSDPLAELDGFWRGLPHKELHGQTRSMITFTPEMFEMIDDLKVAARYDVTALLIGPTGSGKTFLARLIHELSDRVEERFCTVACGALPPDLIESELFGYVKGAFTGADANKEGKFAAAGAGTLLLDEIDVLPLEQQAKLLRVIETGEYEPIGSNETCHSRARLIVASNYELQELVAVGSFRMDLYYRLNILNFHLPPLRNRAWDIEFMARKFAMEHSRTHNVPLREIDPAFLEALRGYHWPGNIRELENIIRRAVLYCQRGLLTVHDLPGAIRNAGSPAPWSAPESGVGIGSGNGFDNSVYATTGNGNGHPAAAALQISLPGSNGIGNGNGNGYRHENGYAPVGVSSNGTFSTHGAGQANGNGVSGVLDNPLPADGSPDMMKSRSLESQVGMLEQRVIEDTLRRNNHRRKETAAELKISRVTLYNKMKKFGLLG